MLLKLLITLQVSTFIFKGSKSKSYDDFEYFEDYDHYQEEYPSDLRRYNYPYYGDFPVTELSYYEDPSYSGMSQCYCDCNTCSGSKHCCKKKCKNCNKFFKLPKPCKCNCKTCTGKKHCCEAKCLQCRSQMSGLVIVPYPYPVMVPGPPVIVAETPITEAPCTDKNTSDTVTHATVSTTAIHVRPSPDDIELCSKYGKCRKLTDAQEKNYRNDNQCPEYDPNCKPFSEYQFKRAYSRMNKGDAWLPKYGIIPIPANLARTLMQKMTNSDNDVNTHQKRPVDQSIYRVPVETRDSREATRREDLDTLKDLMQFLHRRRHNAGILRE